MIACTLRTLSQDADPRLSFVRSDQLCSASSALHAELPRIRQGRKQGSSAWAGIHDPPGDERRRNSSGSDAVTQFSAGAPLGSRHTERKNGSGPAASGVSRYPVRTA